MTQNECFEQWLHDHNAILHRVVNGFAVGDDRNDLMQVILLAVWKAIPSFRGQAQPATFIYRVSHNAALTWKRSEANYRKRFEPTEDFAAAEPLAEVDSVRQEELLDRLYPAIRRLPPLDRSLILLSLDGISYRDMSEIHGLSESNVGARLNRIKHRLCDDLKEAANELR